MIILEFAMLFVGYLIAGLFSVAMGWVIHRSFKALREWMVNAIMITMYGPKP